MEILIIYAHPSRESFTYSVLQKLISIFEKGDHKVTVSDLYKKGFRTELSIEEYVRESQSKLAETLAADVLEEQKLLQETDCVIFLYPVWWSDCPAILKGWFDRVWTNGFAYTKTEEPRTLQTIKTGIAICPAGHSLDELNRTGIAGSMTKIMLNDRMGDRFKHKHMMILAGTLQEDNKPKILEQIDDVIHLISA